jgi:SSS family solute:Na+ symporter
MVALVVIPHLGGTTGQLQYNNAIPLLMNKYLPNGMLGIALTGLLASFMAGVAANVSAFNTVMTTDIYEPYIKPDQSDQHYVWFGRIATIIGIVIGIGTALIASGYANLMNYIQALFSVFNSPLFGTFILAMFWKRMTPTAGFWSLLTGTLAALLTWIGYKVGTISFGSDLAESMVGSGIAFGVGIGVGVLVSLFTKPKPVEELDGLVYGMAKVDEKVPPEDRVWWRNPNLLGFGALAIGLLLTIIFF